MALQVGGGLLERGVELARLYELVAAVRSGTGTVVAVEGPAGIGKTRLLGAACQAGEEAGLIVLRARGGELERELAWGIVRELLERRLRALALSEREHVLSGAARLALPVLGHGGEVALPGGPDGLAAAMHGLYWLVANLSELGGLLIVVDDAHWADQPSRQWLSYLAGRTSDLPVGLLVGARPAEPGAAQDVVAALAGAADELAVLRPATLTDAATAELVRGAFGERAESGFCSACFDASGGNPFVVGELLAELREDGVLPLDMNVDRVHGATPQTLAHSAIGRVRRLAPEAEKLVDAVAVLGSRVALGDAAALARLDEAAAARAADALGDADVLRRGLPLEFVHPLIRAAVYERLPRAQRALAHREAAQMLTERGADDEVIAVHLLEVEPAGDATAVACLRAAAEDAVRRGAPAVAARYLRRALQEPPARAEVGELLYRLGQAETAASGRAGLDVFEQALDLCETPEARARMALEFSQTVRLMGEWPRATRILQRAVAELEPESPLAAKLDGELINVAMLDLETSSLARERLARYMGRAAVEQLDPGLLADLAIAAVSAGLPHEVPLGLARRAITAVREGEPNPSAIVYAASALTYCERFDEALAVWDSLVDQARSTGSVLAYGASCRRAQVAYRLGDIREAEEDARIALAVYRECGARTVEPNSFLAAALIERGAMDEAAALLGSASAAELPGLFDFTELLHTRGRLRLANRQAAEALADLREVGRRLSGTRNPSVMAWRSDAAVALHHLGRREEAVALADEEVELARQFGTPRALGGALRVSGLVRGGDEAIELLDEAVEILDNSPARVARAWALFDRGAALRRSGRRADAREPLRHALELAARAGATRLTEQARGELIAAGARPRRDRMEGRDALTASELRVAEMAAGGKSNAEIAQALFVTRRTVETHLTHIYRKLDISSRSQLTTALRRSDAGAI